MTTTIKDPYIIPIVYLWIGFICAISFMEAWLKFKAPGVNIQIGLGIGRLVFGALNKVEWFFAIMIIVSLFISKNYFFSFYHIFYYLPLLLIALQTFWLLPALDIRAQMHIDGKIVPHSNLHWYYVAMEIIKVVSLFLFSIKIYK